MSKVFISYRREDSQHQADRLHAALKSYVPDPEQDIFIDVDNIPLGVDFSAHLESKVAQCDVLLALIGSDWLSICDAKTGARRLDDPQDFVRVEIASALKRGVAVVPVLLDGAAFPVVQDLPDDLKPLARRNGVELRRLTFDADVERLTRGLGMERRHVSREARRRSGVAAGIALAAVLFAGAGAGLFFADPLGWRKPATGESANVSASGNGEAPAASSEPLTPEFVQPQAGVTQAAGTCGDVEALIYFDFDRSDLSAEGRSILEEALRKTFDCVVDRVVIEAHDDFGTSEAYAMAVSERRASAVAQVFSSAGVEGGAIYQQAFGHSRPWQPHVPSPVNRRVHVKLELAPPAQ
jgi:outer membrane protein OmpA-like peptidoglycan-associated protein